MMAATVAAKALASPWPAEPAREEAIGSFFASQLKGAPEIPPVPSAPALAEDGKVKAGYGWLFDLNRDGDPESIFLLKPGPALSLRALPPPDWPDSVWVAGLPTASVGEGSPDHQATLQNLSRASGLYFFDARALALGRAGLTGPADWTVGKEPSAPEPAIQPVISVKALPPLLLAAVMGVLLAAWQWKRSRPRSWSAA